MYLQLNIGGGWQPSLATKKLLKEWDIMRKEPVRVNIKLSQETNKWVEDTAYGMGLNKSALITMAVENFKTQQKMIEYTPDLVEASKRG